MAVVIISGMYTVHKIGQVAEIIISRNTRVIIFIRSRRHLESEESVFSYFAYQII